jgi:hypothetical protein
MVPIKKYIIDLYGSQGACAEALGVDRKTVYRWIYINAWPMLKYVDKIVETSKTTKNDIMLEILFNEDDKYLSKRKLALIYDTDE